MNVRGLHGDVGGRNHLSRTVLEQTIHFTVGR